MGQLNNFKHLRKTQLRLIDNSSLSKKKEILKEYRDTCDMGFATRVFDDIFDNAVKFYVTSDKVREVTHIDSSELFSTEVTDEYVLNIYDTLSSRSVTGNAALKLCASTYSKLKEIDNGIAELFLDILDKDFGCGVNKSIYEKVFGKNDKEDDGFIRNFGVALANKYYDRVDKVDFERQEWYASRKCDGLRCLCIKKDGVVRFFSRQQKEFFTLGVLGGLIESCKDDNFVLDGELCQINENGDEDFQSIMKLARRKDYTIERPFYQTFDYLTLDEFYGVCVSPNFRDRYEKLLEFFNDNREVLSNNMLVLKQTLVTGNDVFDRLYKEAKSKNWEGLMIRRNVPYEGKRTNDLLKVKDFLDAEFVVKDYETGEMKMIEDGRHVTRNVLTNVIIDYKGNRVSVGSGFSKEERIRFAEHPEEIVGHTITVKYFEETTNQKGGSSMRFPTVKYIYGKDGRTV